MNELRLLRVVPVTGSALARPGPSLASALTPQVQQRRKLLDQVRDAIRTRHYSYRTEKAYVGWIRRFILFHHKRHPAEMGAPEVSAFLSSLATDAHVSASTQNQALAALLFLYRQVLAQDFGWLNDVVRAKRTPRLPVVLTREEVKAILGARRGREWLMVMLLYGTGLRLRECLSLRVKDIDFGRNEITVREGKGHKDRRTMLPAAAREPLRTHLAHLQATHGECIRTVQELLGHADVRTTHKGFVAIRPQRCAHRSPPPGWPDGGKTLMRLGHWLHALVMQTVVVAFSTFIAICPVALAGSAEANGCDSPPVTTAEQAVCLARADLSTGWLGADWKQLTAEAFRHNESRWVEEFRGTRPDVLGGGGRVTVDVNSGKVTERHGEQ